MIIYLSGCWITTVLMFALWCEAPAKQPSGALANFLVIFAVTALWPLTLCIVAGMLIRTAMLRARERAIVEGKRFFRP